MRSHLIYINLNPTAMFLRPRTINLHYSTIEYRLILPNCFFLEFTMICRSIHPFLANTGAHHLTIVIKKA